MTKFELRKGTASKEHDRYLVPIGNGTPALNCSETEWRHFLNQPKNAAPKKTPLSPEERQALRAAENRIDKLVGEIYPKQLEVAAELRKIRERRLYRESHERFEDYVVARFDRTRDWGYKLIQNLEVAEALHEPGAEAPIQRVTARETPHLAKLKKEPAKMKAALRKAEEKAKKENRARTAEDVKQAVASVKKPEQEAPSKLRIVEFVGIKYKGGTTDDVAAFLADFAKWLRRNPTETAFTIQVGEALVAPDRIRTATGRR